ncbi:TPA: fimbrial protein [Klebsiella pneumoniae]|jgi:type 1 fimbria pilin|uniref:fimbrial protein n=1 Tax=Klebsiella/Raoultella group TaxID=2890311 RepID=UPI000BA12E82|nr:MULTISPECIES: fimbrial protein [Klebsiella/Raoultella group]RWS66746.1 type 1 fimbrial protein [Enterobacter cloacae]HCB1873303.1 fimbrial protein [Citrobacter freundii]EKW3531096.1 fimbrial protein [Raoultella planticola]ELF4970394.1 fimbrial protein [Raoultella planticola]ELU1427010.1 fimbrial protein [Raoultella planticola]
MSLSKKLTLFIGLMALGTTSAWAACTRGPAPTVQLDMAMGRVVVNPDLPVGAVIATQNWTMPAGSGINYRCTGTTVFNASIVASGVTDLGNKVYSTNVPGIGMRFSRGGSTVNIIYPGSFTTGGGNFTLEGSRFTLEIIKTAAVTGSGTLAAGKYTSYDWENGNNPILVTLLSANAITVVSPSCTILSGKNMNVDVGTIKRSDLSGVGTTAGGKDFNIELQCSGGLSTSGYANISTSFSGTLATSTTVSTGALLNEKTGSGMAKGIGIQVLKDSIPLEFNKKYSIGTLNNQENRYITLPLHARFYQYESTTSTGEVESHMIFNLTYD